MMNTFQPEKYFSLDKTIAAAIFDGIGCVWEVLPKIGDFIRTLGQTLPAGEYEKRDGDIWIAKDAVVFDSAYIAGPCIIDHAAEVRHCAFIRGNAIVGKGAVVGNSTELKNVILFDGVQVPHYNYVGDSVLGYKAHMGAGAITSNVRSDKCPVTVCNDGMKTDTCLKKMGAIIGDLVEIGCGAVMNPGTIVEKNATVYPLTSVRGTVPENHIYKKRGDFVEKR